MTQTCNHHGPEGKCREPVAWSYMWTTRPMPIFKCPAHVKGAAASAATEEEAWAKIIERTLSI